MSSVPTPRRGDGESTHAVTVVLADLLAVIDSNELPEDTLSYGAMVIASTLASAAMGRSIESSRIVRSMARARGGEPEASVWFDADRAKLPVTEVARVNATMSSASASDSSDLRSMAHPGTPVVAAALAMGERVHAGGREVLEAVAVGYEASNRIAGAISPAYKVKGFHGCLVEIFGAAAAASRFLLGGARTMAQALALSASSIGGIMAAANTSQNREYSAGLAAMLGVEAALAAAAGFQGELTVLETDGGFFDTYGDGSGEDPLSGLGERWGLTSDMAVKLMPGGVPRHAIAEAAANAMIRGDLSVEDVETITISKPGMRKLTGPRYPTDLVGFAHSPAFFAAAGAADRGFTWVHATAEKLRDPVIVALLAKVRVDPDPAEIGAPYRQGATVTITTIDGRIHVDTVSEPLGSAARGLDWDGVADKYRALVSAAGVGLLLIEESLAMIKTIDSLSDITQLVELLRG
jgi:2-methylcitrate dehydratase PrpD